MINKQAKEQIRQYKINGDVDIDTFNPMSKEEQSVYVWHFVAVCVKFVLMIFIAGLLLRGG